VYCTPEYFNNTAGPALAKVHSTKKKKGLICVSMVGVDEAHAVAEWGLDFYPELWGLQPRAEYLFPKAAVYACTATAAPVVMDAVTHRLGSVKGTFKMLRKTCNRDNIGFSIRIGYAHTDMDPATLATEDGTEGAMVFVRSKFTINAVDELMRVRLASQGSVLALFGATHADHSLEHNRKEAKNFKVGERNSSSFCCAPTSSYWGFTGSTWPYRGERQSRPHISDMFQKLGPGWLGARAVREKGPALLRAINTARPESAN
jgi:superfamily II DNA helicase RecQ